MPDFGKHGRGAYADNAVEGPEIGALSRVDKFGESLPILRHTIYPGMYRVEHQGQDMGFVQHIPQVTPNARQWFSHHPYSEAKPHGHIEAHQHRHEAVDFLFGPPGDAPD
jgi:hypothetical protein